MALGCHGSCVSLTDRVGAALASATGAAATVRRRVGAVQNRLLGQPVMAADWDNLVVLGGCRYDTFAARSDLPGRLECRRSRGATTREFLRNNFTGRRFPDTVCVTANRLTSEVAGGAVCHCEPAWRTHWDPDLGTVPPGPMTRRARAVAARFPRKRLVAHYLQPHSPVPDPRATGADGGRPPQVHGPAERDAAPDLWERLADGEVPPETARRVYRQTLDDVLDHVAELVAELPGRTVVTSDHGTLFGRAAHDHLTVGGDRHGPAANGTARPLVEVPWLVVDDGVRRPVVGGSVPEIEAERGDGARAGGATVFDRLGSMMGR